MRSIEGLLVDLSRAWRLAARPTLQMIGCSALLLRTDYDRGTKDGDALETATLDAASQAHLLALAGNGTELATRWRIYMEVVSNGLPFLPRVPRWHPIVIDGMTDAFAVEALDVVDVVVSKLKRFHIHDRADVEAMIERDLVPHDALVERFRDAVDVFASDARAEDLPTYVRHLHDVERDMLLVDESDIELPPWIE